MEGNALGIPRTPRWWVRRIGPRWLEAIFSGRKPWELRRTDAGRFRPGDWLVLTEWIADFGYTGQWVVVRIRDVVEADDVPGGLEAGYALLIVSRPLACGWLGGDRAALPDDETRHQYLEAAQAGLG